MAQPRVPPIFLNASSPPKFLVVNINICWFAAPFWHSHNKNRANCAGTTPDYCTQIVVAVKKMAELCGDDSAKWKEASVAAIMGLEKRIQLWDAIYGLI